MDVFVPRGSETCVEVPVTAADDVRVNGRRAGFAWKAVRSAARRCVSVRSLVTTGMPVWARNVDSAAVYTRYSTAPAIGAHSSLAWCRPSASRRLASSTAS